MLKELFEQKRTYLDTFFEKLDLSAAEEILNILLNRTGMTILCGVGKSGTVAKKIAETMTSIGERAIFLSPSNALHGDIGIVNAQDVCLMFSKSGESEELLHLIPFLRNRHATLVAVVCEEENSLARACDVVIHLPLEQELCPFDMVPTTSTTIQMIFGDVLAIAIMRKKNFSMDQYALNHPAGRIGRRITMKVQDLMITGNDIPTAKPSDTLVDTLHELSNKRCGCVLILNESQQLIGIFTDGDLRRTLQTRGTNALEAPLHEIMTQRPRHTNPDILAIEAMRTMEANQKSPITVLPVLNENSEVVGMIKMHDIVQSGI